ncbi:MAG: hypothetical protein K8R35_01265 [Bacteroidales bacterium]|nr:hypothetical protein [Bacteroidales bacterium]
MRARLPKLLSVFFFSLFLIPVSGQKGVEDGSKYGHNKDSVNCRKNLSLYKTYYDQKNYDMALGFWRKSYTECPLASKNMYLHGIRMYKTLFKQTKEKSYIDSMILVYDSRVKYFGEASYVQGRKGLDLWEIGSEDLELLQLSYTTLGDAISLKPRNANPMTLTIYMAATQKLFEQELISNEVVINNYGFVGDILDARIKAVNRGGDINAKKNIDAIFKASGAGTCDGLIPLFTDKVAATPDDIDLLKKVIGLLGDAGCNDSDLYYITAENLYKLEKSALAAYHLAEMNTDKMNYTKAEYYYKESVDLEEDNIKKSSYYTKMATIRLSQKDNKTARDYAKSATILDPENGTAFMLIGNAYAGIKISNDEFENQAVYWVAVDFFEKAKKIDPKLSDIVDEYILSCSMVFPKKDEGFFRSIINEGVAYHVGGWINENTTVRWRKE